MKLSGIKPAKGSRKNSKRVGRGGAHGKTCCRGSNGQLSRSGGAKGSIFEGGQTPWYRRLPKYRGFKSINKQIFYEVTLKNIENIKDNVEIIDPEYLQKMGLIKNLNQPIKILGGKEISKPLTIKAHKFTEGAIKLIEKAGGKAEVI